MFCFHGKIKKKYEKKNNKWKKFDTVKNHFLKFIYKYYFQYVSLIYIMELVEKIFNFYLSFEDIINTHLYQFSIIFILISILWISLVGIVTPVLLISALSFGYFGILVSLFSLVLGSIINFIMASKTKNIFKKLEKREPIFSDNPIWVYIIFRLILKIPYLIKTFQLFFLNLI